MHETFSLGTADGLQLFARRWSPEGSVRGRVLLVHGYGEHSGRHAYLASQLLLRSYEVHAFDLRGHGQSQGERGYVDSLEHHLADLRAFIDCEVGPGETPTFILGHSFGGLLATLLALRGELREARGLILSSPLLRVPDTTSPLLRPFASLLGRIAPRLPAARVKPERLTHDPLVARRYREDPLTLKRGVPVRVGLEILKANEEVRENAEALTMPVLLLHGSADDTADPEGTRMLAANAASSDISTQFYEGYLHELFNEKIREEVCSLVADWMDARR